MDGGEDIETGYERVPLGPDGKRPDREGVLPSDVVGSGARRDSASVTGFLADASPVALYVYDVATRRNVWCNSAHVEMFGFRVGSEDEILGRIHPEDREKVVGRIQQLCALDDGAWHEIECRLSSGDGRWRWVLDRAAVLERDADGRPLRIVGSAVDITAQRRSTQFLDLERTVRDRLVAGVDLDETLRGVVSILLEEVRLDAVAIRLRHGRDYPFVAVAGSTQPCGGDTSLLCEAAPPASGFDLACLCGMVLRGDREHELLTASGAFWTADAVRCVGSLRPGQRLPELRLRCLEVGFRSLGLFPLTGPGGIIGLLHVAAHEENAIDADVAVFFERLAGSLGAAIARMSAERALADSERTLSSLFHGGPDPVLLIRARDGLVLEVNDRLFESGGFHSSELLGRRLEEIEVWAEPDERARFLDLLQATGDVQDFEATLRTGRGRWRPCSVSARTLDVGGERCVVSVVRDLRDRRRMEQELKRRNRELTVLNWVISAAASAMSADAVLDVACREIADTGAGIRSIACLADHVGGDLVVVADTGAAKGGRSLIGRRLPCRHESDLVSLLSAGQPVVSTGDAREDPRLAAIHDLLVAEGIAALVAAPIIGGADLGGVLMVSATGRGVLTTEDASLALVAAGQIASSMSRTRLSRISRRLYAALAQSPDTVLIWDSDGRVVYVNHAYEQAWGVTSGDLVGRDVATCPGRAAAADQMRGVEETLTAGRVWRGLLRGRRRDGSPRVTDTAMSPIRDDDGKPLGYVEVAHDVTRELELEEQYLQAQKLESIGRLAGGVAHDFNNLLGAILGYAELLQLQLDADHPAQELAAEIVATSKLAASIVRQLLLFARKDATADELVDLNTLVTAVEGILRRLIGEDIRIEIECGTRPALVLADPSQLEQVILNLAVNARDAMPDGGRLRLATHEVELSGAEAGPAGLPAASYVVLSVEDTGVGIPKEIRSKVFEPFFTTKDRDRGTGLGLSTCFGIVTRAGGALDLRSEPGRGTTVDVYLPRAGWAADPATEPAAAPAELRGVEHVLLVEDDPGMRSTVVSALSALGYLVDAAVDGESGWRRAVELGEELDVVVSDVVLPGLSGPALARRLRAERPDLRFVFITGYNPESTDGECTEAGDALVHKPFQIARLAHAIRQVLDGGSERQPPSRSELGLS